MMSVSKYKEARANVRRLEQEKAQRKADRLLDLINTAMKQGHDHYWVRHIDKEVWRIIRVTLQDNGYWCNYSGLNVWWKPLDEVHWFWRLFR